MCQNLNCLPREGGLLDQDFFIVKAMNLVMEAQAEKARKDAPTPKK